VYRSILLMASMMSRSRDSQGLAGMHSLTQDAVTKLGAKSTCGHKVHRPTEQAFEVALHFKERKESDRVGEIDQDVDVAVDPSLASCCRAEESEGPDAKSGQLSSVPRQLRQHSLALVHVTSIAVLDSPPVKAIGNL